MARKHTEDEVLRSLRKKNDVRVIGNSIMVLSIDVWDNKTQSIIPNKHYKGDIGNGTLGKIDYLVNHKGYYKVTVEHF